jgi:eukaryotic-like serine/threonine-protein kinase
MPTAPGGVTAGPPRDGSPHCLGRLASRWFAAILILAMAGGLAPSLAGTRRLTMMDRDVGTSSGGDGVEKTTGRPESAQTPGADDDVEMVIIPGGEFVMGADDPDAATDERPAFRMAIGEFRIDTFEVTNRRYRRCVEAGSCSPPIAGTYYEQAKAEHPATIISWKQALAYCRWVGKRLPTEPEWEKAARGADGRRYPWGDRFEPHRTNAGYSDGTTVGGSHPGGASPYGVMDMAGNVWEWTSSLYRPYPYVATDGREDPEARGARVNRGGSWYYDAAYVRTTYRATADHMYRRVADLGFRCAR